MNEGVHVARHQGSGLKAWGISNTLKSKSGGGFARSERINPKDPKNQKVTSGYRADQVDEKTVRLIYVLGDKHGITSAADRVSVIEEHLDSYTKAMAGRFKITRGGTGEHQYLTFQEYPNPVVAETLRAAAANFEERGDHAAATRLLAWAQMDEQGEDW